MAFRRPLIVDAANQSAEIGAADALLAPGGVRAREGDTGGGDLLGRHVELSPTGAVKILDVRGGPGAVEIFRIQATGQPAPAVNYLIGPGSPSLAYMSVDVTTGDVIFSYNVTLAAVISPMVVTDPTTARVVGQRTTSGQGTLMSVIGRTSSGSDVGRIDFLHTGRVQIPNPNGVPISFAVVGASAGGAFGQMSEFDVGTVAASATVNWSSNGASQRLTLTNATNCTIAFIAPAVIGWYTLRTISPASGTVPSITWPATVKWAGATKPAQAATLGRCNVQRFYFDGTNYWGDAIANAA